MATSAHQLSSSCQRIPSKEIVFSNAFGRIQRSAGTHYVKGTGSLGRLKYNEKHRSLDASDEELEYAQLSQSTHILGRVKSERLLAFNSDENRRRRTIIVEKRNDSYGFTLQSYGIHYTRDQEIETITYVDYVEYDGPAYRSGMREGDVILSINGIDMEKADHKTLVAFIKGCDTRMRMVVLFEDCARKVELHMRYIQLQSLLQNKINELECITLRERELLDGKWKTHSLPARKKTLTSPTSGGGVGGEMEELDAQEMMAYNRTTLSTEDVPNMARYQHQQPQYHHHHHHHHPPHDQHQPMHIATQHNYGQTTIIPPPAEFRLTRHYVGRTPSYKSISHASSGELETHSAKDYQQLERSPSNDQPYAIDNKSQQQQQREPPKPPNRNKSNNYEHQSQKPIDQIDNTIGGSKKKRVASLKSTPTTNKVSGKNCHGHTCNPCIGHFRWKSTDKSSVINAAVGASNGHNNNNNGNSDNVSLDAYDLASPCCDTHCVPTRRRSRHHHHHHNHNHHHEQSTQQQQQHKHQTDQGKIVHKHKQPRPKSQSHIMTSSQQQQQQHNNNHHHYHHHSQHQHQQQHHNHQHHYKQQQQQHKQTNFNDDDDDNNIDDNKHSRHLLHACGSNGSGSLRSQYFDMATGLMSYCSLHSRTSSEFAPADSISYSTSLSTDTLNWEPKSEQHQQQQQQQQSSSILLRQQSLKQSRNLQQQQHDTLDGQQEPMPPPRPPQALSQRQQPLYGNLYQQQQQQQRYHITATQIQPTQICLNPMTSTAAIYVQHKPRSWDNLTTNSWGGGCVGAFGIGYGYGYLDTTTTTTTTINDNSEMHLGGISGGQNVGGITNIIHPTIKLQIAQQRHSIPRKNPYGRFSAYATANVENYAPPPQQFVEEYTTTTTRTTTILAKSTEKQTINNNNNNNNNNKQLNMKDQDKKQQQQEEDEEENAAFKIAQMKINENQKFSHYNNCQLGYYSHLPRPTADVSTSTTTTTTIPAVAAATTTTTSIMTTTTTTTTTTTKTSKMNNSNNKSILVSESPKAKNTKTKTTTRTTTTAPNNTMHVKSGSGDVTTISEMTRL